MKRIILLFLSLLLFLGGCASREEGNQGEKAEKSYEIGNIKITLDSTFSVAFLEGYEACFTAPHTDVFILKEGFDLSEGLAEQTLTEYGNNAIQGNELGDEVLLTEEDGLLRFDYSTSTANGVFLYFTYLYKSSDAFWTVQFAVPEEYADSQRNAITAWAKSVTFS